MSRRGGVHAANYVVHIDKLADTVTLCGRRSADVNSAGDADVERDDESLCRACVKVRNKSRPPDAHLSVKLGTHGLGAFLVRAHDAKKVIPGAVVQIRERGDGSKWFWVTIDDVLDWGVRASVR